ncbi:MAG: hypothetical protein H0W76_28910, partial [Pyrinomonadaceae bacterium]|nr:hypothetical protein [Pyrinomonadaceae bacterium]
MSITKTPNTNDATASLTIAVQFEQQTFGERHDAPPSVTTIDSTVAADSAANTPAADDAGDAQSGQTTITVITAVTAAGGETGTSEQQQVAVIELQLDADRTRYDLTKAFTAESTPTTTPPTALTSSTPDPIRLMLYREIGIGPTTFDPFTDADLNRQVFMRIYDWFAEVQHPNSVAEWGTLGEQFGGCVIECLDYSKNLIEAGGLGDSTSNESMMIAM